MLEIGDNEYTLKYGGERVTKSDILHVDENNGKATFIGDLSNAPQLPDEIQSKLSGWLYGCDICQDVCPWNRFEGVTSETRFEPREGNVNTDLSEIIELTPETYAARFRGSAMKRTKLAGLQRNAQALMG